MDEQFDYVVNQLHGESLEALVDRIQYSSSRLSRVGVILMQPEGTYIMRPVSADVLLTIVILRQAGLL